MLLIHFTAFEGRGEREKSFGFGFGFGFGWGCGFVSLLVWLSAADVVMGDVVLRGEGMERMRRGRVRGER